MSELIVGRNACIEAIRGGRKVFRLIVLDKYSEGKGNRSPKDPIGEVMKEAAGRGVDIEYSDRSAMDRMSGGLVHQGVIAEAEDYSYSTVDDILAFAREREEDPFLILLDGIEDPHNLGAVIRTAECAGAHGVIIPRNRAAEVNETVLRTSAGAAQHMRCARVTNMARAIEMLKNDGIWVYACDMGDDVIWNKDLKGPIGIVIGNEGRGVSRLVRERCDGIISLPLAGRVDSLNASNAAAIAMYEVVRQRRQMEIR